MGKTILTSTQSEFLEFVCSQPGITREFYLTGGTALAEFYFKHRLSEDIDLFIEKREVNPVTVEALIKKNLVRLGISEYKVSQFLGLVSFILLYKNHKTLKVDFNYYPFPRIERGQMYKTLSIDSVYDIAVNKIHTLFMKPRSRDFVDLYFILMQEKYPLEKLIIDAKAKFDWDIDRPTLGGQLMRAGEFPEYPTMLVPFDRRKMEDFFVNLAGTLKKGIFV